MEERIGEGNEEIHHLIRKIKQGDREAFRTMTALYQKKVYLLAHSFFYNRDDALDIVQETFLRLYQKIGLYRKGKNFQNWLLSLAKNICIDYYRKNYKQNPVRTAESDVEEMPVQAGEESHAQRSSDLKRIFLRCLPQLSEKQRMIFIMKHYNGLEYREIAEILRIAQGTVKSLHFKAIQNLRALASPYLGKLT